MGNHDVNLVISTQGYYGATRERAPCGIRVKMEAELFACCELLPKRSFFSFLHRRKKLEPQLGNPYNLPLENILERKPLPTQEIFSPLPPPPAKGVRGFLRNLIGWNSYIPPPQGGPY